MIAKILLAVCFIIIFCTVILGISFDKTDEHFIIWYYRNPFTMVRDRILIKRWFK